MSDAELWQAVYDAPDDDAPRAVLADVLQERGDPRGELIAIQLREHAGHASPDAVARATQLVKQHGNQWLGALRSITSTATLHRGCLHWLSLIHMARSNAWDELLRDASFATVEKIDLYGDELFARVLASPASANLREITIRTAVRWDALAAHPPPRLERLICTTWTQRPGFSMASEYAAGFVDHVLPFVEKSPRITTLGLGLDMVPQLSAELRARLTGMILCDVGLDAALRVWDDMPALERLVVERPFPNYTITEIELVRAGGEERVRLGNRSVSYGVTHKEAAAVLRQLPERFSTIELVGAKQLAKWLRAHDTRFTVIARPLPSSNVHVSIQF